MAPRNYPLDAWTGNTFYYRFVFKQSSGDRFDLTGSKLVFKLNNGGTTILRKDTTDAGSGFEITDAAQGEAELSLTYQETRALPGGQLRYEIERWIATEQVSLMFGMFTVTTWVNDDADP